MVLWMSIFINFLRYLSAFCTIALSISFSVQAQAQEIAVTIISPEYHEMHQILHTIGDVQSLKAPTVRSEVSAQVTKVMIKEGDHVEAGQLLAKLDDTN